jgi:hypothetical protein
MRVQTAMTVGRSNLHLYVTSEPWRDSGILHTHKFGHPPRSGKRKAWGKPLLDPTGFEAKIISTSHPDECDIHALLRAGYSVSAVLFTVLSYFEKIKVRLWDHLLVCVCLCVCMCIALINFWTAESIFIKLGMYIKAPEPISMAKLINLFHQ